jgi:hypothetical protein
MVATNKSKSPREKREFLLISYRVYQNLKRNKFSSRFVFYTRTLCKEIFRNKTDRIKVARMLKAKMAQNSAVKWDCFVVCLCLGIFSRYKTIPKAAKRSMRYEL